jgi:hypothetical protein
MVGEQTLTHQREQLPRPSVEVSIVSPNVLSSSSVVPSKTRIRWTQDLHERFVQCVNHLGGAESNLFSPLVYAHIVNLCTCIITIATEVN